MGNAISDAIEIDGCDMCRSLSCIFSLCTQKLKIHVSTNYRKSDKSRMVAAGSNTAGTKLPLHSGIGAVFTVSNDNQIIYCASAEGG
jgi:hypothetical protein